MRRYTTHGSGARARTHTQATTRVTDGLRRANERGWKLAQLGHVSVRRFLEEPFNDDTAAKEETFSKNDLIRNTQPSDWTCYGGISCAATVCCLQRGWIRATCQVKRADPRYFSLRATQRPIHGGGLHVLLSVRLRRLLNVQPRLPLPSHPFLVMDDVVSIGWSRRLSDARRAASIQSREPRERRRGRSTPRENLRGCHSPGAPRTIRIRSVQGSERRCTRCSSQPSSSGIAASWPRGGAVTLAERQREEVM